MLTSEFDYKLPRELIAKEPAARRDSARLMVLARKTGVLRHRVFHELPELLEPGNLLVLNDTRVFPARLLGRRSSGGRVEALVLNEGQNGGCRTLLKAKGRIRPGEVVSFGQDAMRIRMLEKDDTGVWRFEPLCSDFRQKMEELGDVPLPPYLARASNQLDRERYQTVYSRSTGSAAAPTAGLHFTGELLDSLSHRGIELQFLTLHIGYETFRPVKEKNVEEHVMHGEFFELPAQTLTALKNAKETGKKVIAVGTTSCRVIETLARRGLLCAEHPREQTVQGWTDLFICPGFNFRAVDAMITNFHLPRSTLLMLVAAFAGTQNTLAAYREAVRLKYRFYSYGDAMLVT